MKNISKNSLVNTLQHNFLLLETQAYKNVLSQDTQFKQSDFNTITLILCKEIAYGERKGEIWKITVAVDKRIIDQSTLKPLRTISVEPFINVDKNQESYQYNPATKNISYLVKRGDAEGLITITDKLVINNIILLTELIYKGEMLETVDYIEAQKPKRRLNFTSFIKIPQGRA